MRTDERINRHILGDAFAMHTLHAPRGAAAMLGLDGGMRNARLHASFCACPISPSVPAGRPAIPSGVLQNALDARADAA